MGGRVIQPKCWRWGNKDIIFDVFMRVGNFRVFVLAICKFNQLYSDVWGGKGMISYRWVIYL